MLTNLRLSKLFFVGFTLLWPGLVLAQVSLATQVETGSNLYSQKSYEQTASQSFSLIPAYKPGKNWDTSARFLVTKEAVSPNRTLLNNTQLNASYTGYRLGLFDLRDKIYGALPTSQSSVESEKYQGSLGAGFDFILNRAKGFWPRTSTVGFSATRNFHQYTQNAEGSPNIQKSLKSSLELDWGLTSTLSLGYSFAYRSAYTYEDSVRNNFISGLSIAFDATKKLNLYFGTSTGERAAFKSNGSDSNMTFFDDQHSEVFAGLNYNI